MNQFLKNLSASQQVGFLFATVFGALLLASAISVWHSVAASHHADEGLDSASHQQHALRFKQFQALLNTSWLICLIFWLGWSLGAAVATTLFGLLSFFALREFLSLSPTQRADHRSLLLAFFVVIPAQYALLGFGHFNLVTVFIPVYVFLALPAISALANDPHAFLERSAKLQWGVMVCVYGLSHVPALLLLDFSEFAGQAYVGKNMFLLFYLALVVQVCMLAQHGAARVLKCRPMMPAISQSFHALPWLIGLLSGSLVGGLLSGITPFAAPAQSFVMALLACVAGTMGHLVMKAIKRDRGVKYWSAGVSSVTGAGGLLDRIDALCFAAPVFFHSMRWYFDL